MVSAFEPGTYRFIVEAYVPSGDMLYGCEMDVQVVEGEPLIVALSSIPTYTEAGIHWIPLTRTAHLGFSWLSCW